MFLYALCILVLGFLMGKVYMEFKITQAAKHKKVIAISGDIYTTEKTDSRRDPGGIR